MEDILNYFLQKKYTLATAESCTGGLLGAMLTAVPGISAVYGYGVITYSNEAKMKLLGVPAEILARHGAVSVETAAAMARGLASLSGADYAVSITGIAGPGGGGAEKPVGLVYIGLVTPEGCRVERHVFHGDRQEVRRQSAASAVALIRKGMEEGQ